jgi:hypothetical protein
MGATRRREGRRKKRTARKFFARIKDMDLANRPMLLDASTTPEAEMAEHEFRAILGVGEAALARRRVNVEHIVAACNSMPGCFAFKTLPLLMQRAVCDFWGVTTERELTNSIKTISAKDYHLGRILGGADAVRDEHLYEECALRRLFVPHVPLELMPKEESGEVTLLMRRQLSDWLALSNQQPKPDTMLLVLASAAWCLERVPPHVVELPAAELEPGETAAPAEEGDAGAASGVGGSAAHHHGHGATTSGGMHHRAPQHSVPVAPHGP